jgi:hypothetical protein
MENITAVLRNEATKRAVGLADEVFDLILSAACNQCCDKSEGGNGTCPPPKLNMEQS